MKLLHLADLHLGKRVNGFDLLEDQRYILEQVLGLCDDQGVEAVLLAGDIYDAPVPPAAACTLLDWFLTQLAARQIPVLAISGNHDSAERLDFAAGLLAGQGVYLAGRFNRARSSSTTGSARWSSPCCPLCGRPPSAISCPKPTCPTTTAPWPRPWLPASPPPPAAYCWPTRWWWPGSARPSFRAARPRP